MGADPGSAAGAGRACGRDRQGSPALRGGGALSLSDGHPLARSARAVRLWGQGPHPLQSLGQDRRMGAGVPAPGGRRRQRIRHDRLYHGARASARGRRPQKLGEDQAIGRSKGGLTTKIHALVDALGNPTGFHLTGGQEHDLAGADALLPELEAETLMADKAFDADARVLEPLAEAGKTAVIPPWNTRKTPRAFDTDLYRARHLIENFFAKLKQFRAIAARYPRYTRYTTFLRGVEVWGAVQADGPGRLAGDEELPPMNGLVVCREESFSQQIKANPEDRLSTAFVGLEDDGPVFRLPFTGRVGERKSHGQHSEKRADPVGVNEVGILKIEAARLGSREERFDLPPPPVMGQGDLGIGVGGDYKQVSVDQPRRSQFEQRSKRAVA